MQEEKGEAAALLSLSLCDGATREEGIERCMGTRRRRRWIEGEMREDRGILSLATCVCGGGAGRERGDGPRERWIERGGRARLGGLGGLGLRETGPAWWGGEWPEAWLGLPLTLMKK